MENPGRRRRAAGPARWPHCGQGVEKRAAMWVPGRPAPPEKFCKHSVHMWKTPYSCRSSISRSATVSRIFTSVSISPAILFVALMTVEWSRE